MALDHRETPGPGPILAIGDLHGRPKILESILMHADSRIGHRNYAIVLLGDYLDRGPDSPGLIAAIRKLIARRPGNVTAIVGNHDAVALLAAGEIAHGAPPDEWLADSCRNPHPAIRQYALADRHPAAHRLTAADWADLLRTRFPDDLEFFRHLKWHHRAGDCLFVHAGLHPDRPVEPQLAELSPAWFAGHSRMKGPDALSARWHAFTSPECDDWPFVLVTGHHPHDYNGPTRISLNGYGGVTSVILPERIFFRFPDDGAGPTAPEPLFGRTDKFPDIAAF